MAVTATPPGQLSLSMWKGLRGANPVKVMLIDDTWVFNNDTATNVDAVTGEVIGTGYTAGGVAIANLTETYNAATDSLVVDGDDPSWDATGGALTAHRAVWFIDTGTATTSPIVSVWDFGADVTATNAVFKLQIATAGILVNGSVAS